MLSCVKHAPCDLLRPYIVTYWAISGEADGDIFVVPDAYPELVFSFDKQFRTVIEGREYTGMPGGVFGQFTRSCLLSPRTGSQALMVKMRPWTPALLFRTPFYEMNDRITDVEETGDWGFRMLVRRVRDCGNVPRAIQLIEAFLLSRIYAVNPQRQLVASVVNEIFRQKGKVRVEVLANQHGVGMRQLQQLFRSQVGLSPSYYRKQVRVRHVSLALSNGTAGSLSSLAYDWGYTDPSHLIKDFRSIVQLSPNQYVKKMRGQEVSLQDFDLEKE